MYMILMTQDGRTIFCETKWYRYSVNGMLYYEVMNGDGGEYYIDGERIRRLEFHPTSDAAAKSLKALLADE